MRGYFGIGIINGKFEQNIGTLWRSAFINKANFIFTIGNRYKKQASDTVCTSRHIPLYSYIDFEDFKKHLPENCPIVAVEIDDKAVDLAEYKHKERCVYLLGAEDKGISQKELTQCNEIIRLKGDYCYNVSVAGSIVMYDRLNKL